MEAFRTAIAPRSNGGCSHPFLTWANASSHNCGGILVASFASSLAKARGSRQKESGRANSRVLRRVRGIRAFSRYRPGDRKAGGKLVDPSAATHPALIGQVSYRERANFPRIRFGGRVDEGIPGFLVRGEFRIQAG